MIRDSKSASFWRFSLTRSSPSTWPALRKVTRPLMLSTQMIPYCLADLPIRSSPRAFCHWKLVQIIRYSILSSLRLLTVTILEYWTRPESSWYLCSPSIYLLVQHDVLKLSWKPEDRSGVNIIIKNLANQTFIKPSKHCSLFPCLSSPAPTITELRRSLCGLWSSLLTTTLRSLLRVLLFTKVVVSPSL